MIHVNEIVYFEGLSGTGKTKNAIEKMQRETGFNTNILYLSPKSHEVKSLSVIDDNFFAFSYYSMMYQELQTVYEFPENLEKEIEEYNREKRVSEFTASKIKPNFSLIIDPFLNYFNHQSDFNVIPKKCSIILDDFQCTNIKLRPVIERILNTVAIDKLYICIDKYCDIFLYDRKIKHEVSNIDYIKTIIESESTSRIVCKKKLRQEQYNDYVTERFISQYLKPDKEFMYSNPSISMDNKLKISWYPKKEMVHEYVKKEGLRIHEENPDYSICYTAFNTRALDDILMWKDNNKYTWFEVNSNHGLYGKKYDVIFYIDFIPPKVYKLRNDGDYQKAMVLYSVLSQVKNQIIIATSQPLTSFDGFFSKNCQLMNSDLQSKFKAQEYDLPELDYDEKLTVSHYNHNSMIDTLAVVIRHKDLPFYPVFNQSGKIKPVKYQRSTLITDENKVTFNVTMFYNHHNCEFLLTNVNRLRLGGYNDAQVIKYLMNFIYKYFDYNISNDAICIKRLDLDKLLDTDDKVITDMIDDNYKTDTHMTNRSHNPLSSIPSLDDIINGGITLYCNQQSRNHRGCTFLLYNPEKKVGYNRIVDCEGRLKFEMRLDDNTLARKYCMNKQITSSDILSNIKNNDMYLSTVFDSVIRMRKKK